MVLSAKFMWLVITGRPIVSADLASETPMAWDRLPKLLLQSRMSRLPVGLRTLALANSLQEPIVEKLCELCNGNGLPEDHDMSQIYLNFEQQPGTLDEILYHGLLIYFLNVDNVTRLCNTNTRMYRNLAKAILRFQPNTTAEKECLIWILTVVGSGCQDSYFHNQDLFMTYMLEEYPEAQNREYWRSILRKLFSQDNLWAEWEASYTEAITRFEAHKVLRSTSIAAYRRHSPNPFEEELQELAPRNTLDPVFEPPKTNPCKCSTYGTSHH